MSVPSEGGNQSLSNLIKRDHDDNDRKYVGKEGKKEATRRYLKSMMLNL
jgi:hypothetical protein